MQGCLRIVRLHHRFVDRRSWVFGYRSLLTVPDYSDDFSTIEPLTDRILAGPITTDRRFIDDEDRRCARSIARSKFTPANDGDSKSMKIRRTDFIVMDLMWTNAFNP